MQVTETRSEGLKRSLRIVVPATDLRARLDTRLDELKGQARINGFRPGKVPRSYLERLVGKAEMAKIVNDVIGETIRKAVEDRQEKPALNPEVDLEESTADQVVSGEADLAFTANYELLPSFELVDISGIEVTRPVAEVDDAVVQERLTAFAERSRPYAPRQEGAAAEPGDRVTIDFVGRMDGEAFQGGSGEGVELVLGSSQFIPGFEDALAGALVGDNRQVAVTFPEDYPAKTLAGKPATFDVTVSAVAAPGELVLDDEFAKTLGAESLEQLRDLVRRELGAANERASRQKVKRQLLDQLDQAYRFDLPEKLVEAELGQIWKQVTDEMTSRGRSFADEDTTEEAARAEYRRIAERRVRLGLVLSEIGERDQVEVTDEEMGRALAERIRLFPEEERRRAFDYYRANPSALATVRAPVFEEKVVDHLLSKVRVSDKPVSPEELFAEEEA